MKRHGRLVCKPIPTSEGSIKVAMQLLEIVDDVSNEPITPESERYTSPVAPAPKLRVFYPQFKRRTLGRIASEFGLASADELPPFFRSELVFPAKIGLSQDLDARFGVAESGTVYLRRRIALRSFFESFRYHQAILQCEDRVDLDLTPSGRVLPDERAHSMKALFELKRRKSKGNLRPTDGCSSTVDGGS